MKNFRLLLLFFFGFESSVLNALTVNVTTAGSLENIVANADEDLITDLKIVGPLNNADLRFLCSTTEGSGKFLTQNLKKLDLQDVTLEPTTGYYSVKGYGGDAMYYYLSEECSIVETGSSWLGLYIPYDYYYGDDLGGLCINMSSLEYIALPKKLRGLGQDCLQGSKVSTVVLPENIEYVKYNAFGDTPWYNKYLQTQPDGVVYYNDIAYSYKGNIPSDSTVSFKEGTKRIAGKYAEFKHVNLPNSVKIIGDYCFSGHRLAEYKHFTGEIVSISIPNGLEEIGYGAFEGSYNLTEINIPSSVTTIKNNAFKYCSGLTSVTIPDGMTNIGDNAFEGCSGLTSVIIPSSISSLGKEAFYCGNLAVVEINSNAILSTTKPIKDIFGSHIPRYIIGNDVTTIGDYMFYECSGLTSVEIPNSVTTIGNNAFSDCSSLTSVTIGNSVTSIGEEAFDECNKISAITIPKSVTHIGKDAFYGCSGLTSIEVDDDNNTYDSRENCNAIIETASNTLIRGCDFTFIPESVTSISKYAFNGCHLDNVTIGRNVTSIGLGAFSGCSNLSTVEINSNSILSKEYPNDYFFTLALNFRNIFGTQVKKYIIGNSVERIGSFAFAGCSGMTSITIPNSVTTIGQDAFVDCRSLVAVTIPNSVTSISDWMFYRCSSLTSVTIPESVTSIGEYAFRDCTSLNAITIPNSVTTIGNNAFLDCTSLNAITIPNSVTNIGNSAFYNTAWYDNQPDGLVYAGKVLYGYKGNMPENTSIIIKDGTLGIAEYAFSGCTNLTSITIPYSMMTIGRDAFNNCGLTTVTFHCPYIDRWFRLSKNLQDVIMGDEVTTIGDMAFDGCSSLTSITIPNSVTSIGYSAFAGCSSLTDISISNSVTNIGSSAFYNTAWYNNQPDGLVYAGKVLYGYKGNMPENYTLTIREGTKSIASRGFKNYSQLTSVILPESLTYITEESFYGCKNLDIHSDIKEPAPIAENAFDKSIYENHVLYVPEGTKNLYENTEGWNKFHYITELATRLIPASTEQITSYMSTVFKKLVKTSTDLRNLIVDNMYINIDNVTEVDPHDGYSDGYYAYDMIRINKTTSEEEIEVAVNSKIGSKELSDNFTGIILMVSGSGNIKVNSFTKGTNNLAIMIGNNTPGIFSCATQRDIVVPYNVTEDTYVYIYAVNNNENTQMSIGNYNDVTVSTGTGLVNIYSIDVLPNITSVDNVTSSVENAMPTSIYSLDGKQLAQPQKGLNILKMSDGTTRKVMK